MVTERIQRRIDSLLDEADEAVGESDWTRVLDRATNVLALDPDNQDAKALVAAATRAEMSNESNRESPGKPAMSATVVSAPPASFVSGRYRVLRLLGEGGRKRVYLAHDERLDRDVAFAVIKTEGLDAMGRERVQREARAMARMGGHPNLVSIFDIGEEGGDSYLVQEYMEGGDLALTPRPPLPDGERGSDGMPIERVLSVAKDVARGLAFIHRAGIVHRDLKPGNVFLASDGTAKVGDFGLAMAADLTRITQHGTLVGTVAYMPPEQAVGGEVTAQSDLYSFGALLYELVTGRPPFMGDDPTAIISQHLNTPPVAPSWQREECPPALERVILALLEKDPSKRPADAGEVLSLLEKVDPTERSAPRSEGHVLERLARGVFVGREKELERLRKAFDEAFSGRGGLVMLVGEPGIGKTRTAQELETYARMRGAQVLWGRSHEASGAPAFWPWVQVGRGWGATNDVNTLTPFLASGGSELGRLFPELRTVPGYSEPPVLMDGAAAQFRLFDAYASFVRTISDQKPLVITLDDLHWADKPTLQLLQHLARELGRMRVLVVCTYRDTELVRTHPLSGTLAELNREPGFERVVLRGLGRDEVRDYIASTANLQPSSALVERIYEETEGNPFFLSEVVNLLTQEGTLANDSVSDIRIPDGVKEALGRRLERLSPEANTLLQVAAVVGREFTYDTLQLLHDGGDDALLNQLEEGIEARVVEEMPQAGRYRFTHALMQETLLDELSTTRRVRLHGQVGEALERRWGDRAEEYASRLALHFGEAAGLALGSDDKAAHYSSVAGQQAFAQAAFPVAVRFFEAALSAREGSETDDATARALVDLGRAQRAMLDLEGAWLSLRRAFEYYEATANANGLANTGVLLGSREFGFLRGLPFLERSLAVVPPDSHYQRDLLVALGEIEGSLGRVARAEAAFDAAADLLRTSPDERGELDLLTARGRTQFQRGRFESARPILVRAAAIAVRLGDEDKANLANWQLSGLSGHIGDLAAAARYSALARTQADKNGQRQGIGEATFAESFFAFLRGHWDIARAHLATGLGVAPTSPTLPFLSAWFALEAGDQERARPAIELLFQRARAGRSGIREGGALIAAAMSAMYGSGDEWLEQAMEIARNIDNESTTPLNYSSWVCTGVALLSVVRQDGELANVAREGLRPLAGWLNNSGSFHTDHLTALLALERQDEAGAIDQLESALRWMAAAGECPLPYAHAAYELSRAYVRRDGDGDEVRAYELIEESLSITQRIGMKPLLEKLISLKLELQGASDIDSTASIVAVSRAVQAEQPELAATAAPDGTVTLMFSDIENSTALNELMGDQAWMEVLRAHNVIVEEQVRAHGGRVVKTIGDGYMVVFGSAESGVRCALAVQGALTPGPSPRGGEGSGSGEVLEGIRVRVGVHVGVAVAQGEDFFGREVNYAARVASTAVGGEVLVSERVKERLGSGLAIEPPRVVVLKGFDGEHRLWPVTLG